MNIKIDKVYNINLYLIVFFIPINIRITIYLLYFLFFLSIINFKNKSKKRINKYLIISIFLFLLYSIIITFFHYNVINIGIKRIETQISVLLIPLIFFFNPIEKKETYNTILNFFSFGTIVSTFLCIIFLFWDNTYFKNGQFIYEFRVNTTYTYFQSFKEGQLKIFYSYFSRHIHPAYLSMYIVFSILIIFNKLLNNNQIKKIYFFIILYLIVINFLLSSRSSFICLFVIISIWVFYILKKYFNSFKTFFLYLFILIFFVVFEFSFNSRINQTLTFDKIFSQSNVMSNDRILLWKSSFDIIKNNLIFGVGYGNVSNELNTSYINNNISYAADVGLNTHNQFLEILIALGVIGLILFLNIFYSLIRIAILNKSLIMFSFLIIIVINFFFEVMLNKISGVLFFSYFLSLFSFFNFQNNDSKISS